MQKIEKTVFIGKLEFLGGIRKIVRKLDDIVESYTFKEMKANDKTYDKTYDV